MTPAVDQVEDAPSPRRLPAVDLITPLHHRPLAVFSVALASGIALASMTDTLALWVSVPALIVATAVFLVKGNHKTAAVSAMIVMALACGAIRYESSRTVSVDDISRFAAPSGEPARAVTVEGVVDSDPEPLPGRLQLLLKVRSVEALTDSFQPATGEVYVTIRSTALQGDIDYGDVVSLHGLMEQPKAHTNPGAFSFRDYLARRGVYCLLTVKRRTIRIIGHGSGNPILAAAWRVRRSIVGIIAASLPPTEAAILEGILIGRRAQIPADLSDDFVRTGTVHILASAGLHVGILIGCLWLFFNRLTIHRKAAALSMIAILIFYAVICGGRPSVTRAVIMAVVYLLASLFEREPDVPTTIGAAALIILVDTPYALLEPGFQLSFATVITLAAAMPVWDALFRQRIDALKIPPLARKVLRIAVDLAGMSIFAQLGSAPIVAEAYNEVSLAGALANLLVVPTLFLVIPIGIAAVIFGRVPFFGPALFKVELPLVLLIEGVVRRFGEWSAGYASMETPPAFAIAVYYLVLLVGLSMVSKRVASRRRSNLPLPPP